MNAPISDPGRPRSQTLSRHRGWGPVAGAVRVSGVYECPDARALAEFYARLLDWRIIREDWLVFADPAGHPFCLCGPTQ